MLLSNPSIVSVGSCAYQNKQYRKAMEDSYLLMEAFGIFIYNFMH